MFEKVHTLGEMEAKQWKFEFVPTDLNALVRQVVGERRTHILTCDIEMNTELPEETSLVIDAQQIRWIITELLENAVQFSPLEAPVTAEVGHDNGNTP